MRCRGRRNRPPSLRLARFGEAVAVLHADDGNDLLRALDVLERDVGERDVADLALLSEPRQGFHGGIEGDGRVGHVELVDVDALQAQALQAAFDGLLDVRRAGVVLPDAGAVARPAGFGGDDQVRRDKARGPRRSVPRRHRGRRSRRCR